MNTSVSSFMKKLMDERMKLTGQNGLSDYDLGFTNFLYSFERGVSGRQRPGHWVPDAGVERAAAEGAETAEA